MAVSIAFFAASLGLGAQPWRVFGPVYSEFPLPLSDGRRTEALGPLMILEEREAERLRVFPPVAAWRKDTVTDFTELDLAYPVFTYDRFGKEYRAQIFQLFSISGGSTQEDDIQRRFTLFPIVFYQQSTDPERSYFALVPIYGHLKNRLMRDEIHFVMFPVYSKTRKRDVVTWNYLFPVFHWREGIGLEGWQVWPLIGREHKQLTVQTNRFDEIERIGGHEKLFVLWPFFFKNKLGIGTENPEKQLVILPFYTRQESPLRESTTYFWPFGFTATVDRQRQYREWGAPWPFVVFARGEGKTANRVWPFFSRARNPTLQSEFYLWPVYRFNRATVPPLDRRRTRILFFLYSDLIEENTTSGTAFHRTDLWPLFTARKEHNGNTRLQLLAPLEPLVPNNKSMERLYSPIWSIWRSERNAKTGVATQSFLWNLYRAEQRPDGRKLSLLLGLFQYQSGPDGRRWRLFYLPIGRSRGSDTSEGGS